MTAVESSEHGDRLEGGTRRCSLRRGPPWPLQSPVDSPPSKESACGPAAIAAHPRRQAVAESVYKVIQLVGTSTESWEKAAAAAVERASSSLRDLRVAEVRELDLVIENGGVTQYRAKLNVSFKYEDAG
jgi:hypothetical protein